MVFIFMTLAYFAQYDYLNLHPFSYTILFFRQTNLQWEYTLYI